MAYFIRNWEKFQHYKDRKPQWIKLHADLLDNRPFAMLRVEARAALPLIWIVASENERGAIPDASTLAFRLRLPVDEIEQILDELFAAEFISGEPEGEEREKWASRHVSDKIKAAVFARDGGVCVNCSATENIEYDHIIPISRGGTSVLDNIQLLCRRCNRSKRTKIAAEHVATQGKSLRSLEKRREETEERQRRERGDLPLDGKLLDEIECPSCSRAGYLKQSTPRGSHPAGFWCRTPGGCGFNFAIDFAPITSQLTSGARRAVEALAPKTAEDPNDAAFRILEEQGMILGKLGRTA